MTILAIQKQVIVLNEKQLSKIKGGTDGQDTTNIIIIGDIDVI